MKLQEAIVLFIIALTACTLANLIALKVAATVASQQLDEASAKSPLLGLFK